MAFREPLDAFVDSNFLDDTDDLSTMYVNAGRIRYTIEANYPPTISQQLDDCKFRPLNVQPIAIPRLILPLPKLVGFAGFTVLIYDHLITFADEVRPSPILQPSLVEAVLQVQYIWIKPRGLGKLSSLNSFGAVAYLCPKVVYLFLLVSMSKTFHPSAYD